jgi:predicted  nucleic acid-binding Zn-ribbon protein
MIQADVYHDSVIGRSISAAVCGERTANCERLRNDSDRLKFEVLSLQQELRDKEKQVVALKQTISNLSEKLGLAGSRLKGKSF